MNEKYWAIEQENISPKNREVANEYLLDQKLAGKSVTTIDKYRRILEGFLTECPKDIDQLALDDVHDWLSANYGDKKAITYYLVLSVLSGFSKFCQAKGYIGRVLTEDHWRPRESEQAVKLQAEEEPLRDRTIYQFLLSSGCRRSELAGLDVKDLDLARRTATVSSMGGKIRQVLFSEGCAILLKQYLSTHPADADALFINKAGARLSPAAISRVITRLGRMTGMPAHFHPHLFRHRFDANLAQRGSEPPVISIIPPCANPDTTRRYARFEPSEEIIALYKKYLG
jgi:site-specific recombinase XerD